jgi:hypothetical protein
MVNVVCNNKKTAHFNSVASILRGLRTFGDRRLAAIEAAGRYIYPADHVEERAEIIDMVEFIGTSTKDPVTRTLCVQALWRLDMLRSARLQAKPLCTSVKMEVLSHLPPQVTREALRVYPYSCIER